VRGSERGGGEHGRRGRGKKSTPQAFLALIIARARGPPSHRTHTRATTTETNIDGTRALPRGALPPQETHTNRETTSSARARVRRHDVLLAKRERHAPFPPRPAALQAPPPAFKRSTARARDPPPLARVLPEAGAAGRSAARATQRRKEEEDGCALAPASPSCLRSPPPARAREQKKPRPRRQLPTQHPRLRATPPWRPPWSAAARCWSRPTGSARRRRPR
jgi:hypothetical protein